MSSFRGEQYRCNKTALAPDTAKTSEQEQDLVITFVGFIKDGPEAEKLEGVCGTGYTRNVLNCDVYNGLLSWNVIQLTFEICMYGYGKPLQTFSYLRRI